MRRSKSSAKREVYSNASLRQETNQINNLTIHLRQLEKEEEQQNKQTNKVSRRKEIIKARAEINEIEMKKTMANINETKSWNFEKINKIGEPLARLIKKIGRGLKSINLEVKKEKLQLTLQKYKGSYAAITIDANKWTLYTNKMESLKEMEKFLEKYNLPRLNQEEIEIIIR